jgi:hypothetical protein
MGLELLEQDIRRDFEKNVRHEENRQRSVIFRSGGQAQLRLESKNSGITDVNTMPQESSRVSACVTKHGMKSAISIPVQKGKQIQDTQAWQDVPINLGHQPALGSVREPRQFLIIIGRRIEDLCRALRLYVELLRLHV